MKRLTRSERFRLILEYFQKNQPIAETELHYNNPYELIVAVILSAQCTDKRVNMITPEFFRHFPDPETLGKATHEQVYDVIKSCSYPNNKAKNLIGMACMLSDHFQGIVPSEVTELQKLPGVGRKTANVIASVVFNQPALAVDTHVFRVAARLGLTIKAKNPLQAEMQLVKYIPGHLIPIAHHWLILHGRYVCLARKPRCEQCPLVSYCKFFEKSMEAGN